MRWLIITIILVVIASLLPSIAFKTTTTCLAENDCLEESSFQAGPSFYDLARDYLEKQSEKKQSESLLEE